jgi:hypothetical protein
MAPASTFFKIFEARLMDENPSSFRASAALADFSFGGLAPQVGAIDPNRPPRLSNFFRIRKLAKIRSRVFPAE